MGRVRTRDIRNAAIQLISMFKDKFSKDFENNKKIVKQYIKERKVRNKVAGYITFLFKTNRVEAAIIRYRKHI